MGGSKSPTAATDASKAAAPTSNGEPETQPTPAPAAQDEDANLEDAPAVEDNETTVVDAEAANGGGSGDEDAGSEAETLITSPVKKREAAKQGAVVKTEKPLRSRIGGLPVPGEDDEDSVASPRPSTEMNHGKASGGDGKGDDADMHDDGDDNALENGSDLSSARSSLSRASSRSRAVSERPNLSRHGGSPNPRKRKYRASSVGLPTSKRQSMEAPRTGRQRSTLISEGHRQSAERSSSPKLRSHRRNISTQSALDGGLDGTSRKRRAASQLPARDAKSVKAERADSDSSSETTSRGGDDGKRTQRQTGRSTSTPGGRLSQRELKRHVNKYGFTRLAEACENGDLDGVKQWRVKDPDQIEVAEFAGNKPLQIAALNGNSDVVEYLIKEGCDIDCANADKDTPLIDAAENGHLDVVKLLLNAGVDPLRQNLKGQQALDVVTDDVDDAKQIRLTLRDAIDRWNSDDAKQRREEEEIQRHRGGPSKELHFMARTYENLLKLVTINDRNGVQEFLDARVPVDNTIIAAAAKTGDSYLMSMLLAEMTEKKAHQKPEKPMLAVLGTSHFEMVKLLTELDQFNPLWESRQGKTWPEVAMERNGPMWRQERELLQRLYDQHAGSKARRSSSPVSKRDANGKRRQLPQNSDESDDDDELTTSVPKPKNGRRLMSRKDMRAATKGKTTSDSSDDDDDGDDVSDDAAAPLDDETSTRDHEVGSMKPPTETPNTRRSAGRTRSKSISSQPSEPSPQTRRRSISLRGDPTLPTVDEATTEDSRGKKRREKADPKTARIDREKEDSNRKKEDEAAARVRKAEQEREAAEQRQAEERRRAEEEELAKTAREKAQAHAVEEARRAEEERLRKEEQKAKQAAAERLRADIVAHLPQVHQDLFNLYPKDGLCSASTTAKPVLDTPTELGTDFLLEHFAPLRLSTAGGTEEPLVLNLQAAAYMSRFGPHYLSDGQLWGDAAEGEAHLKDCPPLEAADHQTMHQILASWPSSLTPAKPTVDGTHHYAALDLTLKSELAQDPRQRLLYAAANRYDAFITARNRLTAKDSPVVLRYMPASLVLGEHLETLLARGKAGVSDIFALETAHKPIDAADQADAAKDFVSVLHECFQRFQDPTDHPKFNKLRKMDGAVGNDAATRCHGVTNVVVVHEK